MDITRSNLPPSNKEETILKALLKKKNEQLDVVNGQIVEARSEVASSKEAVKRLTKSSALAATALKTYKEHRRQLMASLDLFDTRFTLVAKVMSENPYPKPCEDFSDLLVADLRSRKARLNSEIKEIDEICAKIRGLTLEMDDELRCQRYINDINAKSLESYIATQLVLSTSVKDIQGAFRAIKRVPDEVWLEILEFCIPGHLPEEFGNSLWLPALHLTHVCRSWRRLVGGNPNMWTRVYGGINPGEEPNPDLLTLWKRCLKQRVPSVVDLRLNVGLIPLIGLDETRIIKYYVFRHQRNKITVDMNTQTPAVVHPTMLHIRSTSSAGTLRIQENLLSRFKRLKGLTLHNVLPYQTLDSPGSLIDLTISLTIPHKRYALETLLAPTLHFLSLQHFATHSVPSIAERVLLPNLRRLRISPLEHKLTESLDMPQLVCLVISLTAERQLYPSRWIDSITPLCSKISTLRIMSAFTAHSDETEQTTRVNMLQVFIKLRPHAPKLQNLCFIDGDLNGGALVDFLNQQDTPQGASNYRLEKLDIDHCTGVSRWDCERLVHLVDKLDVYRTVHGKPAS